MFTSMKSQASKAILGLFVALAPVAQAAIVTVDFENEPLLATQPSDFFAAGASQTYNSPGNYTVAGGVVLGDPAFLASFASQGTLHNLYMTTDIADPSLQDTITFTLPATTFVTGVTGVLFNGQPIAESYVVSAFSGLVLVSTNNLNNVPTASSVNSFANFSLTSTLALPITSVTITRPTRRSTVESWSGYREGKPKPCSRAGRRWIARNRRACLVGRGGAGQRAACLSASIPALRRSTSAHPALFAGPVWVQQGGGPIINGQDEGITSPQGNNPVSGSIQAVAPSATDSNTIYVATTNGGVWKTTNATAATPIWTPLTDQALPALSLGSIMISPLDANVVFAGASLTSSYASDGGTRFGVARSLDAGATWSVVGTNLANKQVRSIVPTSTLVSQSGRRRNIDRRLSQRRWWAYYTQITAGITSSVSDLGIRSSVSARFYAASNARSTGGKHGELGERERSGSNRCGARVLLLCTALAMMSSMPRDQQWRAHECYRP
jgi:hypothetical protein